MMADKHLPKILVVNDDPASLLALTSILQPAEGDAAYAIVSADCGPAALREVLRNDFAVIFLDVNMPGMSGYETAEAIRGRPGSANVPIIFVTAYLADELDQAKAYRCGAADFLFTPIIPQILRAKAMTFVTLAAKGDQARRQAALLAAQSEQLLAMNQRLRSEVEERESAERESHAKDEFLAMLGHELRNPLSAIRSAGYLMSMPGAAAPNIARAKKVIDRQSRILTQMVEQLLDLSRATSGKLQLTKTRVEIGAVIDACMQAPVVGRLAQERKVTIRTVPAHVHADHERMRQVMTHLVENALKYTPPLGSVDIDVACDGADVTVRVHDSGVGIPPELLPRIFNVFVQGSTSIDRSGGGLGIGLALAHQLTALHGGSISAHSAGHGMGSTFVLRLPLEQAGQRAA